MHRTEQDFAGGGRSAMKEIRGEMEVQQAEDIRDSEAATGYLFVHALGLAILSVVLAVLSFVGRVFLEAGYLSVFRAFDSAVGGYFPGVCRHC